MDKQTLIELIKIISPYIIAILGILSPLFTTRYLNQEDFRKFKKQRNFDNNIKVYPDLITELNEINKISKYIITVSDYYEKLDYKDKKVCEYNQDKARIKEVVDCTMKYDEILTESIKKIKDCLKENFLYMDDQIVDRINDIVGEYESPMNLFSWKFQLYLIKDIKEDTTLDTIRFLYNDCKENFQKINKETEQLVKQLKHEITGEK